MYNRYIPQADGTFRRNRMQESKKNTPSDIQANSQMPAMPLPEPKTTIQHNSMKSFLRQLLPQEFDAGDLIIVLLLLLLAGDSQEEKSNALLTLALYFIL